MREAASCEMTHHNSQAQFETEKIAWHAFSPSQKLVIFDFDSTCFVFSKAQGVNYEPIVGQPFFKLDTLIRGHIEMGACKPTLLSMM